MAKVRVVRTKNICWYMDVGASLAKHVGKLWLLPKLVVGEPFIANIVKNRRSL
jgi:hypothetical protein